MEKFSFRILLRMLLAIQWADSTIAYAFVQAIFLSS